jgi:hypothetical protein
MSFNIIKHRGRQDRATTLNNKQVTRQDSLFVPEWRAMVKCAPYDEHFIYENPDVRPGTSAYMCTCGSAAVVAPPGPKGLFVCQMHATTGLHTTSLVNLDKFKEQAAGQTIEVVTKGKKWQ